MKISLGININSISGKVAQLRIKAASALGIDTTALKEAQISKNFRIHDPYTYESQIVNDIYNMREPIAGFARRNNIAVDVYNPNAIKGAENFKLGEAKDFTDRIAVVVTDKNSGKFKVDLFDTDSSKLYPKEAERIFIVNVPGEETQVVNKARWTTEDNLLRHIFRSIESMTNSLKKNG